LKHFRPEWGKAIREIVQQGVTTRLLAASCQPTADEVDDFQSVVIRKLRLGPARSRNEVAVEFDGDAVGLEAKFGQERGYAEVGGKFAVFAVDDELHSAAVACGGVGLGKLVQPFLLLSGLRNF
jgi:hypothetical protein